MGVVTSPSLIVVTGSAGAADVDPGLPRHRGIIEGRHADPLGEADLSRYLTDLVALIGMTLVIPPVVRWCGKEPLDGWSGWAYLVESGVQAHCYRNRPGGPPNTFSADIYSCRAFDLRAAAAFTAERFSLHPCVAWPVPIPG